MLVSAVSGREFHIAVGGDEFIEYGDLLAGADFAAVLGVVFEIFRVHHAVFVSDQPIAFDVCRVEVDLHLCVLCDGVEGSLQRCSHDAACFHIAVDVAVVSISFIRKLLCESVVVIAASKSKYGEEDLSFCFLLYQIHKLGVISLAEVEIAIRQKQNAIISTFHK